MGGGIGPDHSPKDHFTRVTLCVATEMYIGATLITWFSHGGNNFYSFSAYDYVVVLEINTL
jgi:hypothetical protein